MDNLGDIRLFVEAANLGGLSAAGREWAVRGYGIAMKSMWDIEADLRAGRLKILMPDWKYPQAPLHALYHRNRYMAPRVRALLDFLIERFAKASGELEALLACPGDVAVPLKPSRPTRPRASPLR